MTDSVLSGQKLGQDAQFERIRQMGLYEQIYDFDNLIEAYIDVQRGKGEKLEFNLFSMHAEEHLINLHNHLVWRTWKPGETVNFRIFEPKERNISRPILQDRILEHAVINIVKPTFYSYFSPCSHACIEGRGTLNAVFEMQKKYRSAIGRWGFDFYVIHGDFRKYFETIDHGVLRYMLLRLFKDEEAVDLMMAIAGSHAGNNEKGIAIGSPLSQHEANLVASILDYYVTDQLGVGAKCYQRYMDDFRILVHTREEAERVLEAVYHVVETKMRQELSEKKTYIERYKGCDTFCGYIIHPHHLRLKTPSVKRHRRRIEKFLTLYQRGVMSKDRVLDSIGSYEACLSHAVNTEPRIEKWKEMLDE